MALMNRVGAFDNQVLAYGVVCICCWCTLSSLLVHGMAVGHLDNLDHARQ